MKKELTPWWMMKDDPNGWIHYQHQFSVSVNMEYSVQPSISKNKVASQTSFDETATMFSWLEKRMLFRRQTYSIISMLDRLQIRSKEVPIDWLNILCVEENCDDCIFVYDDGFDQGISIKIGCDPDTFFKLSECEKSKWVINVVEKACKKIIASTDIELIDVLDACEQIKNLNYENEWIWGERLSPDEKLFARVSIAQDIHKTRIAFEVYKTDGILLQKIYIEDSPYLPDLWKRYLNDIDWTSDRSVRLHLQESFLEIGLEEE